MIVEDRDDGGLTLASRSTGFGGEVIESNKHKAARENAEANGGSVPVGSASAGGDVSASAAVTPVAPGGNTPVAPAGTSGTTIR